MRGSRLLVTLSFPTLLFACGSSSSSSSTTASAPPSVRIDRFFTTEGGMLMVPAKEERGSLSELELPCDGLLGVGLVFGEGWKAYAPGGCGTLAKCGHFQITATTQAGATQSQGGVLSPALLTLLPSADWSGMTTVEAKLIKDDGMDWLDANKSAIADQVSVPLSSVGSCATPTGGNSAGGAGGADDAAGGTTAGSGGAGG